MQSPLRTLLAQPWLRFRFSLLSFLLGSTGHALVLRLRGYRVTEVEQNGLKANPRLPPDDSPGPGVLLWIEEQPSSLAAAS